MLREILAALDDKLTSDDLDGIIAEIDTDGSGTVDFDGKQFSGGLKMNRILSGSNTEIFPLQSSWRWWQENKQRRAMRYRVKWAEETHAKT